MVFNLFPLSKQSHITELGHISNMILQQMIFSISLEFSFGTRKRFGFIDGSAAVREWLLYCVQSFLVYKL